MMVIPEKIQKHLAGESYSLDCVGLSDSTVLLFDTMVLKIQRNMESAQHEAAMMNWLQGRLNVPRVLETEVVGEKQYLLMSRLPGEMSCADRFMRNPKEQGRLLAKGLRTLWDVDVSRCPVDSRLKHKLELARFRVEHNLVDLDNTEPGTFGEGGFADPAALLQWLMDNQPEEEPVLSHGDYCLPNVFILPEDEVGFLDLGRAGIADKWCDIALCYRSLSANFSGRYHGKAYSGYDDLALFRELGFRPDWDKIRYYILLDELF